MVERGRPGTIGITGPRQSRRKATPERLAVERVAERVEQLFLKGPELTGWAAQGAAPGPISRHCRSIHALRSCTGRKQGMSAR